MYMGGVSAPPPEVTINSICDAFGVDPVRAIELWGSHRRLVIACLDAKAASEAFEMERTNPRAMSPDQVDWLTELKQYVVDYNRESGRAEKERLRREELQSFQQ